MKVVCDNCRAVYKVPDDKLTKAVNKATCRNCGHRMLIPRPKPNADPEERTLVTAVPPTPVGAPPRASERPTSPMEDERESTLPGRQAHGDPVPSDDDLRVATPMMMAGRVGDTMPAPDDEFEGEVETKLTANPTPEPGRRVAGATGRGASSLPPPRGRPTPPPAQGMASNPPARRTPPSAPPRRTPAPAAPRSTPGPAPRSSAPPPSSPGYPPISAAAALHDPAADLNWALLGTGMALVGSFLLAFLSIWNHPLVMWFGLAMTFGGGILSFMVLMTGARGRRPAKTLLSVVLGFLVAVVMSSAMVGTKWGAEKVIDAYDIHFSQDGLTAGMTATPAPPQPADAPSLRSVTTVEQPNVVPAGEPPAPGEPAPAAVQEAPEPAPEPAPERPQPGRPKPPPTPKPARPTPSPSPSPVPVAAAPPPAPAPAPGGLQQVPIEAVHVMISNNLEVKKCFVPLFKAGTLPPRVDLKFNILPSGSAQGMSILQGQFKGSELESCLTRAIGGIRFPPTTGSGTSITYPFLLQ